jgi:hypothetical protein
MINASLKDTVHEGHSIKAIFYQCNKCMSIEHLSFIDHRELSFIVPCTKCSGLAVKLQVSDFLGNVSNKLKTPS